MKVIVTGHAGFIGSHLCDDLLKRDYEVIGIDNFSNGKEKNIKHLHKNKNFTSIKGDIMKRLPGEEEKIFENVDAIFHFAANSDIQKSSKDPSIDFRNTFHITVQMLDYCRKYNIKNFIFSSTSAIYGDTNNMKVPENHGPLIPQSHYGAAKLSAEAFISSYAENFGIKSWIIRFPNVCGSRMTHGAIYDFIKQLQSQKDLVKNLNVLGDGKQCKPYIHVSELINAIIYIWLSSARKVNIYNVAPETQTTVADIAKWCGDAFGEVNIKFEDKPIGWTGDIAKFQYNTSRLQKLGFELKMTSDEAVKTSIHELIKEKL